jgi:hypothetical protein
MVDQITVPAGKLNTGLTIKSLYTLIPWVMGMAYWLAFYPGVLSFDSVLQWDQLSRLAITDTHPAIHTIFMWLLTRLWYSPAIISLFQVTFASLVIGYGLNSIQKATRLSPWVLIGVGVLISANPLVGIMNVTLWKDVIYSWMILLLTIFLFNMIITRGEWITSVWHFIGLGICLASIWLFRFNGFPVVLTFLLAGVIIYKKYNRQLLFGSLVTLGLIILVQGPLYSLFKVNRMVHYSYGIALIHPVVAYISQGIGSSILTDQEKAYLDQISPLNKPWPYSCYDGTVFYYNNTDLTPVMRDPGTMARIFIKLAMADPLVLLRHYVCLSSFAWQPNQPHNVYLETILFDNYNLNLTPEWKVYQDVVTQKPILMQLHQQVERVVNAEWHRDTAMILWRPAVYMYAFLIGLVLLTIRARRWIWLLLAIPLATQSIVIMFTTQLQALRYQYPVYLISMMFTITLFILAFKDPNVLARQIEPTPMVDHAS